MEVVRSNHYLASTLDTDGLVLLHKGISIHNADYAHMRFHSFMG